MLASRVTFTLVSATMWSVFATFYDGEAASREADGSCDGPGSGGEVTTPYTFFLVLASQVAIPAWSFLTTTTTTTTT